MTGGLRVLTVVDGYTWEFPAIVLDRNRHSSDAIQALAQLLVRSGFLNPHPFGQRTRVLRKGSLDRLDQSDVAPSFIKSERLMGERLKQETDDRLGNKPLT